MIDLTHLTDEELHAEYDISQETLKFHKEQVGQVSAQLRELNQLLRKKKQERDEFVAHYDAIRDEFSRRKAERRTTHTTGTVQLNKRSNQQQSKKTSSNHSQ